MRGVGAHWVGSAPMLPWPGCGDGMLAQVG